MSKRPGKIVAVDTNVLIWGIRKDGPEEMKQRAKWLFATLDEDDARVVVPAVCLAEYLIPIRPEQRSAVASEIGKAFLIQPVDPIAAIFAAGLWETGKKQLKSGELNARLILKTDILVVGCAKAAGATELYTNDDGCRALARRVSLTPYDLPTCAPHLFASYPRALSGTDPSAPDTSGSDRQSMESRAETSAKLARPKGKVIVPAKLASQRRKSR